MYTPLAIANTMIDENPGIYNSLWLNKAVHFVHGWSLAFGMSIVGELPAVWKYGPIYASLYDELKHHKMDFIHAPQIGLGMDGAPMVPECDEYARGIIRQVIKTYSSMSATDMSSLAHHEGTPWREEAKAHNFRVKMDHKIPEWRIKAYFHQQLAMFKNQKEPYTFNNYNIVS